MIASTAETFVVRERTERTFAPLRENSFIGTYRIIGLLGQGAIGLVYLAEHDKLKRKVALKVLRDELASNPKAVARFFGEARAVNAIAHENIVEITDFVEADPEKGLPSHYIMELLAGRTLKEALEQENLAIDRVIDIGMQIASALDAVHQKQIIHRDLKPANIFIVEGEHRADFVKLLDFGVAKLSTTLITGQPDTGSGMIIGTPGYMAPEQIAGGPIDHRADIYALGVVLYEMVVGRQPFVEEDILELLYKHCDEEPPPPIAGEGHERIPRRLAQLILECLQKDPAARPQSGDEVFDRLRAMRDSRRRRKRLIPAATLFVVVATVMALLGLTGEPAHSSPQVVVQEIVTEKSQKHVLVHFNSEPLGAEVFMEGELLGRTPFTKVFDRGADPARFAFRLDGHDPADQELTFTADAHVQVALKAHEVVAPTPPKRRSIASRKKIGPISKAELRNPFE